jgi:hypothetical protein
LCEKIKSGSPLPNIIDEAKMERFEIRSETHKSSKERDWFNRQYDRFLDAFKKMNNADKSLTIIFAKPGIGYYACVMEHRGDLIIEARFLDRSS